MECPNCGAPMAGRLKCAYCGYENELAAERMHEKEISGVYARIARLLHVPVQRAKKLTRGLLIGAAVLVIVFSLALAGAFIYSKVAPGAELQRQQAAVEKMEALYAAGDYAGLTAYLEKIDDSYRAVYDKYTTVAQLHESLIYAEESAAEDAAFVAGFPEGADLLDYDLEQLFEVLHRCRTLEEQGFVYGEADAAEAFAARAEAVLRDTLLLTESEIAEGLAQAAAETPDYSALREASAARLCGGTA